jgi:hypothetical protein
MRPEDCEWIAMTRLDDRGDGRIAGAPAVRGGPARA